MIKTLATRLLNLDLFMMEAHCLEPICLLMTAVGIKQSRAADPRSTRIIMSYMDPDPCSNLPWIMLYTEEHGIVIPDGNSEIGAHF